MSKPHGGTAGQEPDGAELLHQLLCELGDDRAAVEEILQHARNPTSAPWSTGSNSFTLTITNGSTIVENEFNEQKGTLPLGILMAKTEAYQQKLVTDTRSDPGTDTDGRP